MVSYRLQVGPHFLTNIFNTKTLHTNIFNTKKKIQKSQIFPKYKRVKNTKKNIVLKILLLKIIPRYKLQLPLPYLHTYKKIK